MHISCSIWNKLELQFDHLKNALDEERTVIADSVQRTAISTANSSNEIF